MINKNEQLGKKLSGKEMKQVQGGLAPCAVVECGETSCSACHYYCVRTDSGSYCVGFWETW